MVSSRNLLTDEFALVSLSTRYLVREISKHLHCNRYMCNGSTGDGCKVSVGVSIIAIVIGPTSVIADSPIYF